MESVTDALLFARGDLFLAAAHIGCTARQLDGYIRASDELKSFVCCIGTIKVNPDYDRMTAIQFSDQLEQLTRAYRVEAIDIIHDLATMPFENAAMAEVKLKAAVQLRGVNHDNLADNSQSNLLQELNKQYLESAPRIKSIRAVQIEME